MIPTRRHRLDLETFGRQFSQSTSGFTRVSAIYHCERAFTMEFSARILARSFAWGGKRLAARVHIDKPDDSLSEVGAQGCQWRHWSSSSCPLAPPAAIHTRSDCSACGSRRHLLIWRLGVCIRRHEVHPDIDLHQLPSSSSSRSRLCRLVPLLSLPFFVFCIIPFFLIILFFLLFLLVVFFFFFSFLLLVIAPRSA